MSCESGAPSHHEPMDDLAREPEKKAGPVYADKPMPATGRRERAEGYRDDLATELTQDQVSRAERPATARQPGDCVREVDIRIRGIRIQRAVY